MSDEDFLVYYDKEEMDKFEKEAMKKYGLELGREEGRAEGQLVGEASAKKEIITNMISNGITIPEISKMINMSEEEINGLLD